MEQTLWLAVLMMGCAGAAGFILLTIRELLHLQTMRERRDEADCDMVHLQEYNRQISDPLNDNRKK